MKIKKVDNDTLEDLLKVSSLGTWKVSCRLPDNQAKIIGVIGPIGLETDIDELHSEIGEKYPYVL